MPDTSFSQATDIPDNERAQPDASISQPDALTVPKTNIEAIFNTLLNQSVQPIWLLDAAGNMLKANQTALTFSNVDALQVRAQPVYSVWQFSEGEQIRLKAAISSATHGRMIRYDAIIQGPHDKPIALNVTLHAIAREPGQPILLMMEGHDVSARKQLETQLRRCQRLQSVGSMTVGLAHDLSNLLTPVLGVVHLLHLEFPNATKDQNELFKVIGICANRATRLVKQMLAFTRGDIDVYTYIESERLLKEVQSLIRVTVPESIKIESYVPSDLWAINGSESQLHQVLVNLCLNARDAMPNGGFLRLSAENIQIDHTEMPFAAPCNGRGTSSAPAVQNYVAIQVSDTGTGIPESVLESMFEPFVTTKETGLGSGLGLSTVKDIVASHGGFVDVLTEATHMSRTGTQFWVYLPALA